MLLTKLVRNAKFIASGLQALAQFRQVKVKNKNRLKASSNKTLASADDDALPSALGDITPDLSRSPAWFARVDGLVNSCSPRTRRIAAALLALFLALTGIQSIWAGPTPILHYGHDVPAFLDGAWRVYQGQRPHVDFYTPVGPCFFFVIVFGMLLVGPATKAIVLGSAAVFAVLGIWAWLIARNRLAPLVALCFSVLIGLLIISPYTIGTPSGTCGYAMLYNRYCQAMLGIVMIEALISPRRPTSRGLFLGGMSSGALLVILFFTKYSFVAAAGVVLLVGLLLGGRQKQRIYGFLLGLAIIGAPMAVYYNGNLTDVLTDIFSTARFFILAAINPPTEVAEVVEQTSKTPLYHDLTKVTPLEKLIASLPHVICLQLLWFVYAVVSRSSKTRPHSALALALAVAAVDIAAVLCLVSSTGVGDCTPLLFGGFVLYEAIRRQALTATPEAPNASRTPDGRESSAAPAARLRWDMLAAYVGCLVLTVPFAIKQCDGIRHADVLREKYQVVPHNLRINAAPLKDLIILGAGGYSNEHYAAKLNEGFDMLRGIVVPEDQFLVLDFSNPFSFGLQQRSHAGDSICYVYERNFSKTHHWPPEELFRDVSILMFSRYYDPEASTPLAQIYGDYIQEHFKPKFVGTYWALFLRKADSRNNPDEK